MLGNIVDIKRFCLHDGPGIRSTVFLKGCGLHCAWCHNPEGIDLDLGLWYLPRQCIRCRACLSACPEGALSVPDEEEGTVWIDRRRCVACGRCVEACPTGALAFDGQRISSEQVVEILLRDRDFYDQSGGGITLSGGDPLIQHSFAREILGACRAAGVRTAIETCLHGPWVVVESFLPVTDATIVDLKLADRDLHQEYTRHDNLLIRSNYRRLASLGLDLLTRIPLIPRITATEANLRDLARFIADCGGSRRVELINYNPLAVNKYQLMNLDQDFFRNMEPLDQEELSELYAILQEEGLEVVRDHRV